ncbi:hypothetical protein PQR15_31895 [Streptomyces lydicus]|nr:hypothetical protein [Streptomyces lydicus]
MTLSLATAVCPPGSVAGHHEAAAALAPLKKEAKALPGRAGCWAGPARSAPRSGAGLLRGCPARPLPHPAPPGQHGVPARDDGPARGAGAARRALRAPNTRCRWRP